MFPETVTGQLRAEISITRARFDNAECELSGSDDLRTIPHHRFDQEYGGHTIRNRFLKRLFHDFFDSIVSVVSERHAVSESP